MATITSVRCPERYSCCAGKCGGETVTASFGKDTVTVSACSYLLAQGWTGANVVLWHSQAVELETASQPQALQHTAGLVVFA